MYEFLCFERVKHNRSDGFPSLRGVLERKLLKFETWNFNWRVPLCSLYMNSYLHLNLHMIMTQSVKF